MNGHMGRLGSSTVAAASPNLLIVDGLWNVVIASATDIWESVGVHIGVDRAIPPVLQTLVNAAIESSHLDRSMAFCIRISPWPGIAITVCAVDSARGQLLAITAQEFQARTSLRHAQIAFGLSPRELEILRHVLGGAGTSQIAITLNIADSTVIAHVKSLLFKTHAANRAALVARVLGWEEALTP